MITLERLGWWWRRITQTQIPPRYDLPTVTIQTHTATIGDPTGVREHRTYHIAIDNDITIVIDAPEPVVERIATLLATHGLVNFDNIPRP